MFSHLVQNTLFKFFPEQANKDKEIKDKTDAAARKISAGYYGIETRKDGKALVSRKGKPADTGDNDNVNKKPSAKKPDGKKRDDKKGGCKKGNSDDGGDKPNKTGDWSSEEDAKLRSMKAEGKPWKEIMHAIGRDMGQVKQRWKSIEGQAAGGGKVESTAWSAEQDEKLKTLHAANTNFNKIAKELSKDVKDIAPRLRELGLMPDKKGNKGKEQKPKDENSADKEKPAGTKKDKSDKAPRETMYTAEEWKTLQADSRFSLDELRLLASILEKPGRTWGQASAAFYDQTGRRVDADDIRDKFAQLSAMSA